MYINNIIKLFGKINPSSLKCLRFGFSLTVILLLASLTAMIFFTYSGNVLYFYFSGDMLTCASDSAMAIVITSLFWDIVVKLGKYDE